MSELDAGRGEHIWLMLRSLDGGRIVVKERAYGLLTQRRLLLTETKSWMGRKQWRLL